VRDAYSKGLPALQRVAAEDFLGQVLADARQFRHLLPRSIA